MKLFTVAGAVGLAGLVVALAGFRLSARDVIVTDLAWIDPEDPQADVLPSFKKRADYNYPRDISGGDQPGYVLFRVTISAAGENTGMFRQASHPYFGEAVKVNSGAKFTRRFSIRSPHV